MQSLFTISPRISNKLKCHSEPTQHTVNITDTTLKHIQTNKQPNEQKWLKALPTETHWNICRLINLNKLKYTLSEMGYNNKTAQTGCGTMASNSFSNPHTSTNCHCSLRPNVCTYCTVQKKCCKLTYIHRKLSITDQRQACFMCILYSQHLDNSTYNQTDTISSDKLTKIKKKLWCQKH